MKKLCIRCGNKKSLSKFGKRSATKDGLKYWCRECMREYQQMHYQIHKVEISEKQKKFRRTTLGQLHMCFKSMKYRCNNPKYSQYKYYGGRGIKCLFASANEFIDYVINELQINPHGLMIDRINNDGHYEKKNIRFVTAKVSANNRRKKNSS